MIASHRRSMPKLIYHDSDGMDKVVMVGAEPVLIGRATEEFAATLDGSVPFTRCGDLATAVAAASAEARHDGVPGAVVLLSPACASYDQFKNFEERGDTFRSLVEELREAPSR